MLRERRNHKYRLKGFSLIELLAVMSIMTILLALLMPSLTAFTSTSGRRASVNTLMNAFEQARVEALSKSKNIFVVMRRQPNESQDSFIIMRDDRSADLPNGAPPFVALTRWKKLSSGILFHQASGSLTSTGAGTLSSFPAGLATELPGNVPVSEIFAIGFNKYGQVNFPSSGSNLWLFLAEAQRGSSADSTVKGASTLITERLSFRRYTGRAQLDFTAPPKA